MEIGSPVGDILLPAVHYGPEMEEIACDFLVNAAGSWVGHVAAMADIKQISANAAINMLFAVFMILSR